METVRQAVIIFNGDRNLRSPIRDQLEKQGFIGSVHIYAAGAAISIPISAAVEIKAITVVSVCLAYRAQCNPEIAPTCIGFGPDRLNFISGPIA